jgi:hypothetical protein
VVTLGSLRFVYGLMGNLLFLTTNEQTLESRTYLAASAAFRSESARLALPHRNAGTLFWDVRKELENAGTVPLKELRAWFAGITGKAPPALPLCTKQAKTAHGKKVPCRTTQKPGPRLSPLDLKGLKPLLVYLTPSRDGLKLDGLIPVG